MMRAGLLPTILLATLPLLAETAFDYAEKIHGKDSSGNKISCRSYENDLMPDQQRELIEHAMLAASAYQDQGTAYGSTKSIDAYKETSYDRLSKAEVDKLIAGSGLKSEVDADGNVTIHGKNKDALNAVLFKDATGTIVISYRGSKETQDWIDDGLQAVDIGVIPDQYKEASALLGAVLKNTTADVVCDGHSLGGGLVTYAMADNDIMGVDANGNSYSRVKGNTYNAAGLSESTVKYLESKNGGLERIKNASANIINVRNEFDPVSYVGYHLGENYEVRWASSLENAHTPTNDHSLEHLTENMISAAGLDNVWSIIDSPTGSKSGGQGGGSSSNSVGSKIIAEIDKLIDAQLDKLTQNHPVLKEIFKALGINGSSIRGAAVNIFNVLKGASSWKSAFAGLSKLAVEGLKNMAASLINWGLDKLEMLINNLINKALDWLEQKILKWTYSIDNKWLRMGLGYLETAFAKWRKNGGVATAVSGLRKGAVKWVQGKVNGNTKNNSSGGSQVFQQIINKVH